MSNKRAKLEQQTSRTRAQDEQNSNNKRAKVEQTFSLYTSKNIKDTEHRIQITEYRKTEKRTTMAMDFMNISLVWREENLMQSNIMMRMWLFMYYKAIHKRYCYRNSYGAEEWIEKGEMVTTVRGLCDELNTTSAVIRRNLSKLERYGLIGIRKSATMRLKVICVNDIGWHEEVDGTEEAMGFVRVRLGIDLDGMWRDKAQWPVLMWLIMNAKHKECYTADGTLLHPGEILTSLHDIAQGTGLEMEEVTKTFKAPSPASGPLLTSPKGEGRILGPHPASPKGEGQILGPLLTSPKGEEQILGPLLTSPKGEGRILINVKELLKDPTNNSLLPANNTINSSPLGEAGRGPVSSAISWFYLERKRCRNMARLKELTAEVEAGLKQLPELDVERDMMEVMKLYDKQMHDAYPQAKLILKVARQFVDERKKRVARQEEAKRQQEAVRARLREEELERQWAYFAERMLSRFKSSNRLPTQGLEPQHVAKLFNCVWRRFEGGVVPGGEERLAELGRSSAEQWQATSWDDVTRGKALLLEQLMGRISAEDLHRKLVAAVDGYEGYYARVSPL